MQRRNSRGGAVTWVCGGANHDQHEYSRQASGFLPGRRRKPHHTSRSMYPHTSNASGMPAATACTQQACETMPACPTTAPTCPGWPSGSSHPAAPSPDPRQDPQCAARHRGGLTRSDELHSCTHRWRRSPGAAICQAAPRRSLHRLAGPRLAHARCNARSLPRLAQRTQTHAARTHSATCYKPTLQAHREHFRLEDGVTVREHEQGGAGDWRVLAPAERATSAHGSPSASRDAHGMGIQLQQILKVTIAYTDSHENQPVLTSPPSRPTTWCWLQWRPCSSSWRLPGSRGGRMQPCTAPRPAQGGKERDRQPM